MRLIVCADSAAEGIHWQQRIENEGEQVSAEVCTRPAQVFAALDADYADAVLLLPGHCADETAVEMTARPPLSPPYLLGGADGPLPQAEDAPLCVLAMQEAGVLPVLAQRLIPAVTGLAASLLRQLGAAKHLRAWAFLPQMLAYTVVFPPCLLDVQHRLYPMSAQRHGLTAQAVERRLRLWIENAWARGNAAAQERFFGATVDPDRGKPTNREFLCGLQPWMRRAARRLRRSHEKS